MQRRVKGALFVDYVRMLRSRKDVDWSHHLTGGDMVLLREWIQPDDWYPMETFERMGNAVLSVVAADDLDMVRDFGRQTVEDLWSIDERLIAAGDPRESLMRFKVLRSTFFDFEALEITLLLHEKANLRISYGMADRAEEAAAHQTAGFFEELLRLAGATEVQASFVSKRWDGQAPTIVELRWQPPKAT